MTTVAVPLATTTVGGPSVQAVTLDAAGVPVSGLLALPDGPPRATLLALHGAGMTAGYFHGPAHESLSLLTLGARLGMAVLALDRPGYGASTGVLPHGQRLAGQCATVRAALSDFATRYPTGAGVVVVAHSFGGKLALALAAGGELTGLLGLDISGCGHRYAVRPDQLPGPGARVAGWGPLGHYPPDTFATGRHLLAPVPAHEAQEMPGWPGVFATLAPAVRVPVRTTFAEHEPWWRHDRETLAEWRAALVSAPRVLIERQPHAGHNISLGWAARAYHLRVLGFAEDLIAAKEA